MDEGISVALPWADDALDRQKFAQYLTRSLITQSEQNRRLGRGLTISLDADWGAGKSFFVKHWATDLQQINHPTVYFDAWENDIGDETSVALMAAILKELDAWKKKLGANRRIKRKAAELSRKATRTLRRAVLPTATVIAKGVVKKVTGIAIDEIHTALTEGELRTQSSRQDSDDADKVLDDLFEKKLSDHASRKETIKLFRAELHELIELLGVSAGAELPVFVFLDELDRCRPLYAMQLLEEVKHLFGVVDVVFIVSTNLSQLQYSVRALYGVDFDGARYLKRLFDREYVLPPPDNESFASIVISPESYLRSVKVRNWLPNNDANPLVSSWSWVANLFGLDLRSQKQVFGLADEVAKVLYAREGISCVWLFFLCVVSLKNRALLNSLETPGLEKSNFEASVKSMGAGAAFVKYRYWDQPGARHSVEESVRLVDVLWTYYGLSTESRDEVVSQLNNSGERRSFPDTLLRDLFDELVNHPQEEGTLRSYVRMVRLAGYVTAI